MNLPPLDDEAIQKIIEAWKATGSYRAAARETGHSDHSVKKYVERAAAEGKLGTSPVLPGFRISKTTTVTDEHGITVREFIQQRPDAGGAFTLPEGHQIKGVSALLDAHGNVSAQWVKTKEGERSVEAVADAFKEAFADWMPPPFPDNGAPDTDDDLLTIYPIADLHLGLKASADECGAAFDLDIATERFRDTTAKLFARSPNSNTALILQLGDFTHADDDLAMTPTSKNILQVSDRQLDVIKAGVQMMIDYVYHALTKHERVIVKCLKGNHDLNSWVALYVALDQHFRDNDRVTVDGGAADYWFFRWGMNLIGAHHGHRLKPPEMAGAMATECAEDWGQTLYRIFLHGHLHHEIVKEVLGVRVECFRTLAEQDAHHAGKYNSNKSLISITLHKQNGEDGRAKINLPPTRRRAAQVAA